MTPDRLKTGLLDLLHELADADVKFSLGGGYGLFLKQTHLLEAMTHPTLIPPEAWPAPRATRDLDIFLHPEIVTDSTSMATIRGALEQLSFAVIEGREYMQFQNPDGIKIDLHVGPLGHFENLAKKRSDDRRVGPRPSVRLHAHRTDEAVAVEQESIVIPIHGVLSTGAPYATTVEIPQAFSYLMMKLFAFRDGKDNPQRQLAQHHALDAYRVIAMLTEPEYNVARRLASTNSDHPRVVEAQGIVEACFGAVNSIGNLRIREHPLSTADMNVELFLSVLQELFPRP